MVGYREGEEVQGQGGNGGAYVRPYVLLNAAMTLDGKIATKAGDSKISCHEDLVRVHRIRAEVDAIMVGVGTILIDDPSLTVRLVKGRSPIRVVVDGRARTPTKAKVLTAEPRVKTIIAVSSKAPEPRVRRLREAGAEVISCGKDRVDLKELMKHLWEKGIRRLLLEGGSSLNWSMLSQGLVDEVSVAIAPIVVGGEQATTLVGGEGFARIGEGVRLEPLGVERWGEDWVLKYRVAR